ncbi:HET-domain-containing protein, partial [Dothidotthia symphoricarpi CBS 119687]
IRLIEVLPGMEDEAIQCRIYQVNLDADPKYEAVSYTWADERGDRSQSKAIICSEKIMFVTPNCERAMRRFRRRGLRRTLWIDSVCIDQETVREKNHQVSIMKDIYTLASRVLIYAGDSSLRLDHLLKYIDPSVEKDGMNPNDKRKDADELFCKPWFQRIWIVQEVVLAKVAIFYIGSYAINWTDLSKRRLSQLGLRPRSGIWPGVFLWTTHRNLKVDLLAALHATRNCLASDSRDKIFALLSLIDDPSHTVQANYELSVVEVFTHIAVYLITSRNSLAILSHLRYDPNNQMPSWIPDWS